jgi:hypothetical protein
MKIRYHGAYHHFDVTEKDKPRNSYTVRLLPTGEAYVNGKLVGRYDRPNSTYTRALNTLKLCLPQPQNRKPRLKPQA